MAFKISKKNAELVGRPLIESLINAHAKEDKDNP